MYAKMYSSSMSYGACLQQCVVYVFGSSESRTCSAAAITAAAAASQI